METGFGVFLDNNPSISTDYFKRNLNKLRFDKNRIIFLLYHIFNSAKN
jgi:hypothetical protein